MDSPTPPPIARFVVADDEAPELSIRDYIVAGLRPWGSSAMAHSVVLLILLLWTIPIIQNGSLQLTAFTGLDDSDVEELSFSLEDLSSDDSEVETDAPFELADLTIDEPMLENPAPAVFDEPDQDISEQPELVKPTSGSQQSIASGSVSDADSIEQAVDQITGGIRGQLQDGDVLVVWLLDASLSLKDDRQRVAKRLETFLTDIEKSASTHHHRLLNSVVSFGRRVDELISPTKASKPVLHSIKTAPTDSSGTENVFIAVEKCVSKYRSKWKSQMMIVVWTDESGDDVERLSKTIDRCRKAKVTVSVVGPSAVLGADTGLHAYTDPKTNLTYQLPVKRGPDAAMPERLQLDYWFPSSNRSTFPSWYGGDDLAGITSGFSPYALTRLATSTGGSYTIFDRPEDRAPFDLERMKDYLPAYGSTKEYRDELEQYPLRRAVHAAVKVTYAEEIDTPDLMFFGQPSPEAPHKIDAFYFTPTAFQAKLRANRGKVQRQLKRAVYAVEKALQEVSKNGNPEEGLNYEYDHEPSPRWRAWYDLTRGRLLATSVRLEEYRMAFEQVTDKGFLNDDTNGLMMRPTSRMQSDEKFARRAEAAADLLSRCREENMDTPWSYLAERELADGLGVVARQMVFHSIGQMQQRSGPNLPKF